MKNGIIFLALILISVVSFGQLILESDKLSYQMGTDVGETVKETGFVIHEHAISVKQSDNTLRLVSLSEWGETENPENEDQTAIYTDGVDEHGTDWNFWIIMDNKTGEVNVYMFTGDNDIHIIFEINIEKYNQREQKKWDASKLLS